jgi:hypothetical protein
MCSDLPSMPRSYFVPDTYFDGITDRYDPLLYSFLTPRVPPGKKTEPTMVPQCDHKVIQPPALDAYTFETERYIASSGLNIYDGACWSVALALLGEDTEVETKEGMNESSAFCGSVLIARRLPTRRRISKARRRANWVTSGTRASSQVRLIV